MLKRVFTLTFLSQFVLLTVAYTSSLTVTEQGNIIADTNRYLAQFENGVLVHLENKLTNEIYTQGDKRGKTTLHTEAGINLRADEVTLEIHKMSELAYELVYEVEWDEPTVHTVRLHMFIGIDPETDDLLIRQKGYCSIGFIYRIAWGFGNLSPSLDVIIPRDGGQILVEQRNYPNYNSQGWETPLVIVQGQNGGVFVHGDPTKYDYNTLRYETDAEGKSLGFWTDAQAPFDNVKEIESSTWSLNTYQGDWEVSAQIYRDRMPEKSFDPAWVDDINVVIIHSKVEVSMLEPLSRQVDPSQTLIYMHGWRHGGHDKDLPDYGPDQVLPDFAKFVEEAHRYGFKIMVHVNMLGVSLHHPLYAEFEKYHIRIDSDQRTGWAWEEIGAENRHAFINTASTAYRRMFVNTLQNLRQRYNIDAFHFDINLTFNDHNGRIDGLSMIEGNIRLYQEVKKAMPGIVLGGEVLDDRMAPYMRFVQWKWKPHQKPEKPHRISCFLFSKYLKGYTRFIKHPELDPEEYALFLATPEVCDEILLTLRLHDTEDFVEANRPQTFELFARAREKQNWRFGDINDDGVVNILDLVLVAQALGNPDAMTDINRDGVVNILDLVLVAQVLAD